MNDRADRHPDADSDFASPRLVLVPAPDAGAGVAPEFVPSVPDSLAAAGVSEVELEALVLKFLLARGDADGHAVADQVRLPFALVQPLLARLKQEQLVSYRGSRVAGDFVYALDSSGLERARALAERGTYFGAAPVPIRDYLASVEAQSLRRQHPRVDDVRRAFADISVEPALLDQLGPALNSGRGMFLFGAPGNGKTSIAERVTRAFGRHIWIPRAVSVDGELVRVFDPLNHVEVPLDEGPGLARYDRRWVRIERPTIVVGGELTAAHLEVAPNALAGVSDAPIQLKSNCGTLVIDDFGRQRIGMTELLNRWIVPLERGVDFLRLPGGKVVQVPFDQLLVFSTNLDPASLVDDAFLRRVPYKIEVGDPGEAEFRRLFSGSCVALGFAPDEAALDYLVHRHYLAGGRPFRRCEPRDLLERIRSYCQYHGEPPALSPERIDFAAHGYFVAKRSGERGITLLGDEAA